MRSDESTWQLGLAKATISSSSSSAGIFLLPHGDAAAAAPTRHLQGDPQPTGRLLIWGPLSPSGDCWMGW